MGYHLSFAAERKDGADRDQPPEEGEPRERGGETFGLLREFRLLHYRDGATRGRQGPL